MHDFNSVSGMWSEIQLKRDRMERRGDQGKRTNVEGIKRERGEEGEECEERERRGWLHSSTLPLVRGFLDRARGSREGRKVEGGGKERDGAKGRGQCGFCLLPTFQSQS